MFDFIKNLFGLKQQFSALSVDEIRALSVPRSSKWRKLRQQHIEENPRCAVCGSDQGVVPHHITPVHLDSDKELDQDNLITLCENRTFNCHLFFGHLRNWSKHNPNIVEDAKMWKQKIEGKNDNI